jgi:glycosyltransferase involved in cell wall biosynthesis
VVDFPFRLRGVIIFAMKINFVVPPLAENRFSGGILCVFEYAHGLAERGHSVNIIPIRSSPRPRWYSKNAGQILTSSKSEQLKRTFRAALATARSTLRAEWGGGTISLKSLFTNICFTAPGSFDAPIAAGIDDAYVRANAPIADVNIATSFRTARPVSLLPGSNFYFAQHFEPYFCDHGTEAEYECLLARQSYTLGLHQIANSQWLKQRLQKEFPGLTVDLCPNAVDHGIFRRASPRISNATQTQIVVITYGGRGVEWKGFKDMIAAMGIARRSLPDLDIEWRVYGDVDVPPDNPVAPYTHLGFLSLQRLAEEYLKADILLSASWYESFPLFPLEAMASGLAVITTQPGTEEYATASVTAEVVEPRNPASIAAGLIRIISDPSYRHRLAERGAVESLKFNWTASVDRMEDILLTRSGIQH